MVERTEQTKALLSLENQPFPQITLREIVGWCQKNGLLEILTEKQRAVLVLHWLDGLSLRDISSKINQGKDHSLVWRLEKKAWLNVLPYIPESQRGTVEKLLKNKRQDTGYQERFREKRQSGEYRQRLSQAVKDGWPQRKRARREAKGKLIEFVKKQIEAGDHQQLTALERNYLGLLLGTNLPGREIAKTLNVRRSTVNQVKDTAFARIFQFAGKKTKREVANLFIRSGLGWKSPFFRYEQLRLNEMKEYAKRPEVKKRARLREQKEFKSIDKTMRVSIIHQAITDGSIDCLTERQRHVILARYPIRLKTLKELARELGTNGGITRERVRRIEAGALRKLINAQSIS